MVAPYDKLFQISSTDLGKEYTATPTAFKIRNERNTFTTVGVLFGSMSKYLNTVVRPHYDRTRTEEYFVYAPKHSVRSQDLVSEEHALTQTRDKERMLATKETWHTSSMRMQCVGVIKVRAVYPKSKPSDFTLTYEWVTYTHPNMSGVTKLHILETLGIDPNEYMIVGSAAAMVHGMPISNNDIDIIISDKAFDRYSYEFIHKEGVVYSNRTGELDVIRQSDVELLPMTADSLVNMAFWVGNYRVATYETLTTFYSNLYRMSNQPKHKTRLDWLKVNSKDMSGIEELFNGIQESTSTVDDDSFIVPSAGVEALTPSSNSSKRKAVETKILKVVKTMDPSGTNHTRYKEMFSKMSDKEFHKLMEDMRDGKAHLYMLFPNMEVQMKMDSFLKAADLIGLAITERLRRFDSLTGKTYVTPHEYLLLDLPVRRARQFLKGKSAMSESNTRVDALTGQVVKPDRASALSYIEMQLLYSKGLDRTITEFSKVRGGDIVGGAQFNQQLDEAGQASLNAISEGTVTQSSITTATLLTSLMFDHNLVEGRNL